MQEIESRVGMGIAECPVCGKNATVEYDARYGYTCACSTPGYRMRGNRASYYPTEVDAILNWNGLVLAIDMSRAKGGVDEQVMARIFGPIPDDSNVPDESGSESE